MRAIKCSLTGTITYINIIPHVSKLIPKEAYASHVISWRIFLNNGLNKRKLHGDFALNDPELSQLCWSFFFLEMPCLLIPENILVRQDCYAKPEMNSQCFLSKGFLNVTFSIMKFTNTVFSSHLKVRKHIAVFISNLLTTCVTFQLRI